MTQWTVVATGANSGIGFQVARYFAQHGARVVMACRSVDKGLEARERIRTELPNAELAVMPLDVSELGSIREFARRFAEQIGELDLLINNAGILGLPLTRTSAGHEMQLATNYLGAFTLTGTLLPYFSKQRAGRIVNVGSIAHRFGSVNLDDLNWERRAYNEWKAYASSKVALLSHTLELHRRLRAAASPVVALAAHPGFANTNIKHTLEARKPPGALRRWYAERMKRFIPSAEQGARSVILAATSKGLHGGEYYGPGGPFELGGAPKPARINPLARQPALGKQLWEASEAMTGERYLSGL